jgi:hypothetical protein
VVVDEQTPDHHELSLNLHTDHRPPTTDHLEQRRDSGISQQITRSND